MPPVTSKIYRLTHPGQFEIFEQNIPACPSGQILARPVMGSICAADLRYYLGRRRTEALKKKLPMALLHEAVGVVESSSSPEFSTGDRVVLIPNIPGYIHSPTSFEGPGHCCPACSSVAIGENYCKNIRFLSSGFDGFTRSHVLHPVQCLAKVPDTLPTELAVLAELATVGFCAALRTLCFPRKNVFESFADINDKTAVNFTKDLLGTEANIGVWGDGPVGYTVASWLSFLGTTKEHLVVFGTNPAKLANFDFATTIDIGNPQVDALRSAYVGRLAAAFECVGGEMQHVAANDAIECLQPGGKLGLLGVNEGLTALNVRDVLEKGLALIGCSRSPRQSYQAVLRLLANHPLLNEHFRRLIVPPIIVNNINDLQNAFHFASGKADWGKVLISLNL